MTSCIDTLSIHGVVSLHKANNINDADLAAPIDTDPISPQPTSSVPAASVDLPDVSDMFLNACTRGDLSTLTEKVFVPGVETWNVNCAEKMDGDTGLMLAIRENKEEVVRFLVENTDIDVNSVNKYGYTALMQAAQNGNLNILNLLLSRPDTDLELVNRAGRRAEDCARKKHRDGVRNLISEAKKRKLDLSGADTSEEPLTKVVIMDDNVTHTNMNVLVDETKLDLDKYPALCNVLTPSAVNTAVSDESETKTIPDELKTILTARLENCLIDLGSPAHNLRLCLEMFSMGTRLGLAELATISKKALLEYLSLDTVFTILEVLQKDPEVREICLNFIVANIDKVKVDKNWKQNLAKIPDIAVELVDRL